MSGKMAAARDVGLRLLTEFAYGKQPRGLDPTLLTELEQAETHLENGVAVAKAQNTQGLAQSIAAIARQANDLMRVQMRGLRLSAQLSQTELARRIGVRPKVISDFEAGTRTLPPERMQLMREAVGAADPARVAHCPPGAGPAPQTAIAAEEAEAFEVVATGTTMEPSIHHGDRLIVRPGVELAADRVIVARHGDAGIVKRLVTRDDVLVLRSDNADEELELSDVTIQGVVVEVRRTA